MSQGNQKNNQQTLWIVGIIIAIIIGCILGSNPKKSERQKFEEKVWKAVNDSIDTFNR